MKQTERNDMECSPSNLVRQTHVTNSNDESRYACQNLPVEEGVELHVDSDFAPEGFLQVRLMLRRHPRNSLPE